MTIHQEPLLLDACVAINLYATDQLTEMAQSLNITFLLVEQAAAEVGHLRETVAGDLVVTPVDLSKHIEQGAVQLLHLRSAEYPLYVALASLLGDGEAATIAISSKRRISMATDDRKARRVCASRSLPEPRRTLALIRSYAEAESLGHGDVRDMLLRVRGRASFTPPRSDPDLSWWARFVNDTVPPAGGR
ncbi:MAG TPA: hypothetical protein VFM55_22585 [Micromonosporaceae bacterium]|nr:hypothetical protein [Micromonosporaceae bacterium]